MNEQADRDLLTVELFSPHVAQIKSIHMEKEINHTITLTFQNISPLKPSGHYMYHQVEHSAILRSGHTVYYVFYVDLRTNSDYFPIQH